MIGLGYDERGLIERARGGDRDAFCSLMEPYVKPLGAYAAYKVPADDADDVVQDAMLSAWLGLKNFNYQSSFKTWVYAIARRKIADYYRIKPDPGALDEHAGTADSSDALISRMDVERAVSRLKAPDRELLFLVFNAGLSYAETAGVLEIPVGTVKSRMAGVKGKLKNYLGGYE